MYWTVLFCWLLMKVTSNRARSVSLVEQRPDSLELRTDLSDNDIEYIPHGPEDLPEAEPISPGQTLIQPSVGMLVSAVKYPQKEDGYLVYGNLDNLGITYGKTNQRVLYTGFRRDNNILNMLLKARMNRYKRKPVLVFIRGNPPKFKNTESKYGEKDAEEDNNASEILDDELLFGEADNKQDYRRKSHKYRERESSESTDTDKAASSGSSEYERNPGNPFTVYKDKYIQNWIWNHYMDGDHMNLNPYAPQFNSLGPSGAALFFNRKWWYYNQDDFIPFD